MAVLGRAAIGPLIPADRGVYLIGTLATLGAALFCGLWTGLLTTLLVAFLTEFFWAIPRYTIVWERWQDAIPAALYLVVGTCISLLASHLRRARRLAESTAVDLAHAKEDAEAANAAKDHFLAVLSHELRTPLNPVVMIAGVLERNPDLPQEAHEDAQTIRHNAEMAVVLIDDLLDVNRIIRGKLTLKRSAVDAHTVVRQALATCEPDIAAKHMQVHLDLSAPRSTLDADPARVQQVFWNLIKNAAKFTPPGGTLTVRSRTDDSSLVVEVSDTGIGIDPDAVSRLFVPFEQTSTQITQQFGGLGLGLAISRSIVEMHGGQISARSEGRGRGTSFTVKLPLAP